MRFHIVEGLRNVDQMEYGQKPVEWEAQVFNRSRTREEYVKLVATLIWKLRDYNKKVYFNFDLGHIMKTQISGSSKSYFLTCQTDQCISHTMGRGHPLKCYQVGVPRGLTLGELFL